MCLSIDFFMHLHARTIKQKGCWCRCILLLWSESFQTSVNTIWERKNEWGRESVRSFSKAWGRIFVWKGRRRRVVIPFQEHITFRFVVWKWFWRFRGFPPNKCGISGERNGFLQFYCFLWHFILENLGNKSSCY